MEKDSIRANLTKEDMISVIKMELNADIDKEYNFLLYEGNDDKKFCRRFFCENVVLYESFSGKAGLQELLDASEIQDNRVIAIRDKDYMNVEELPERMFVYDESCLELMLLKNTEVLEGFCNTYYNGDYTKEQFIMNALKRMAPYSIMRMKNEQQVLRINFDRVGFGDLIKDENQFDMEKLFERLGMSQDCYKECCEEAQQLNEEQLYDITNGHDICSFIGEITYNAKKKLGEAGTRNALLNAFRKSDFEKTKLYDMIKNYQTKYQLKYID